MVTERVRHYFKPSLFWDVDIDTIDINKHKKFIIERVIKKGSMHDWHTALSLYGKDTVRDKVLTIRTLDPKSLNFLSLYFGAEKKSFRCYS